MNRGKHDRTTALTLLIALTPTLTAVIPTRAEPLLRGLLVYQRKINLTVELSGSFFFLKKTNE